MCEKFMLGKDIVFCISVRGMGEQDCVPSGSDWVLWGLGFLSWYGERLENKSWKGTGPKKRLRSLSKFVCTMHRKMGMKYCRCFWGHYHPVS